MKWPKTAPYSFVINGLDDIECVWFKNNSGQLQFLSKQDSLLQSHYLHEFCIITGLKKLAETNNWLTLAAPYNDPNARIPFLVRNSINIYFVNSWWRGFPSCGGNSDIGKVQISSTWVFFHWAFCHMPSLLWGKVAFIVDKHGWVLEGQKLVVVILIVPAFCMHHCGSLIHWISKQAPQVSPSLKSAELKTAVVRPYLWSKILLTIPTSSLYHITSQVRDHNFDK